jgi:chromosome segregation ATPase
VCTAFSSRPSKIKGMSEVEPTATRRPPGRPRKWASEAERKRAYRTRRAADLAEPERLRLELRQARAQIAELEREAFRLRRTATRATTRAKESAKARADLEATVERLHLQVTFLRNLTTETTRRQSSARTGGSSSRASAAP